MALEAVNMLGQFFFIVGTKSVSEKEIKQFGHRVLGTNFSENLKHCICARTETFLKCNYSFVKKR